MPPPPTGDAGSYASAEEALRSCEVIAEWSEDDRLAFAAAGEVIHRRRGTLLHRHGARQQGFYVLLEGAVEFSRVLPDGHSYVMPYVPPGQLFGIASLLGDQPHIFDVRTRLDSRLLRFDRDVLRAFLLERPLLLMSLAAELCRRYSRQFEQVEIIRTMGLRQRLARVLLELAASFGEASGNTVDITIRVAQEDLAAMTAASRQRVNAEFGALMSEGLLTVSYGRITIHDIEKLRSEAGRTSTEP